MNPMLFRCEQIESNLQLEGNAQETFIASTMHRLAVQPILREIPKLLMGFENFFLNSGC